jgi:hypothetical protein
MKKAIWAVTLMAILLIGGGRLMEWIERAEEKRFSDREEMVRHAAQARAADIQRVFESSVDQRADVMATEIQASQRSSIIDSLVAR